MKKIFTLLLGITLIASLHAQTSPLFHPNWLEGPDGPDVQLTLQSGGIKIDLTNQPSSNNFNESFLIADTSISNGNNFYDFQGYLIYQAINDSINFIEDFFDATKMRLVGQSDILDSADNLTNYYLDTISNTCIPANMVNGNNMGIQHSYQINIDAFSGNVFQQGERYCYYTFAYAYNGNKLGDDCNQPWPYFMGFSSGSNGGGIQAKCIAFNVTSLNENNNPLGLTPIIYPNPVSQNLKVSFKKAQDVNLFVLDVTGKILFESKYIKAETIPLKTNNLKSGIYFVKMESEEGVKTLKFIKQ